MKECKLIRVDDRLIHGQVVVGWASRLQPQYLILIDDDIANDDLVRDLYLLGVPEPFIGLALDITEGVKFLQNCNSYLVVVKSPSVVLDLLNHGLAIEKINLGGMHAGYGKKEFNHYVFVDEADILALTQLKNVVTKISIQDLPGEKEYSIEDLLSIKL